MNDIEPMVSLEEVDPGVHDPGYWARSQARILQAVQPSLAAITRSETMGEALLVWGRLFVPVVAAAAAVVTLVVFRPVAADDLASVAGLEEILQQRPAGEDPLPAFLHTDVTLDRDMVLIAMEEF